MAPAHDSQEAPGEASDLELKESFDLDSPGDRLQLVKEIVAMANASGGTIYLGVTDDGASRPGIDEKCATALDPARLTDLVDPYISPDHLELRVSRNSGEAPGRVVVSIAVPAFPDPPLVLCRKGEYVGADKKPVLVFRQQTVYRRKGTKAEPASRQDFREWIAAAVTAENDRWRSRVALLSNLPPGAVLEVRPSEGAAVEEPGSFLSRAVAQYRSDPNKLLSTRDLLAAFVARSGTTFDDEAHELLIQSALRRRPTLFFWLRLAEFPASRVRTILYDALRASDRDKSDAGRAIVEVAALYLDDGDYQEIIDGLATSRYAHFREAAAAGVERADVLMRLEASRPDRLDGTEVEALTDQGLSEEAARLAGELLDHHSSAAARKLSSIGVELLWRTMSPGFRPAP